MIYSREEKLPQRELDALILDRLRATVERVYERVPYYTRRFDSKGVKPSHVSSLADIKNLPFTRKTDLRDNYPLDMLAVPRSKVVKIHASSGATGKPTLGAYTAKDLDTWAELVARCLTAAGVREGDMVQNAFPHGLPTGGHGINLGAQRIGAMIVPSGKSTPRKQAMLIDDLKVNALCASPETAIRISFAMREMGIFSENLELRVGLLGSEPWSESMRVEIEDLLGLQALDIYGLSEMFGPGVACECIEAKNGPHVFMDHFYPEIINPSTGELLPHGEQGELVLTSLTKEALPLVRYRTRDITRIIAEPCSCGRTTWRIAKALGRTDDLLIIDGVKVFPSEIENALMNYQAVKPNYVIRIERVDMADVLTIFAEVKEAFFLTKSAEIVSMEARMEKEILDFLGVNATVLLVPPNEMRLRAGETRRILDFRKI